MLLTEFTDEQLSSFVENYRKKKASSGGKFALPELLLEQMRRKPTVFGPRETATKIVELARTSVDGFCTYGAIWSAFRPNEPWEGHKTQRMVANALAQVVRYCCLNKLPILSSLVVNSGTRQLDPKAIQHIYDICKELGVDVGSNAKAFVTKQAELSRALCVDDFPT